MRFSVRVQMRRLPRKPAQHRHALDSNAVVQQFGGDPVFVLFDRVLGLVAVDGDVPALLLESTGNLRHVHPGRHHLRVEVLANQREAFLRHQNADRETKGEARR